MGTMTIISAGIGGGGLSEPVTLTQTLTFDGIATDIAVTATEDLTIKMGDAAGSNKVSFVDSGDVEVASIDSDGDYTGRSIDLTHTGSNTIWPIAQFRTSGGASNNWYVDGQGWVDIHMTNTSNTISTGESCNVVMIEDDGEYVWNSGTVEHNTFIIDSTGITHDPGGTCTSSSLRIKGGSGATNQYTLYSTTSEAESVRITGTGSGTTFTGLILESDSASPATNDRVYLSYYASDAGGTQVNHGAVNVATTSTTAGNLSSKMEFRVATTGTLTTEMTLFGTSLDPGSNPVKWSSGAAAIGSWYMIGRNSDATNLLQLNVPTNAWFEFTINDGTSTFIDTIGVRPHTDSGITASTTQTQGQQALVAEVNEVSTVANANDVVTLPAAAVGRRCVIMNNGANTLQIFPASGDNLGAGVDTSTTLASGSNVVYQAYDATNWEVI